jgi:energy-coupling factor transporter ATP-binding protein EcfA2
MAAPLRLTQLAFSDGTEIPLDAGSIVVLVGPNNTGKSRALRELSEAMMNPTEPAVVTAQVAKHVDSDGFNQWLREHAHILRRGVQEVVTRPPSGEIPLSNALPWWESGPPFNQLGLFFALLANTEQRLQLAGTIQSFNPLTESPSAPLQVLYLDAGLEHRLATAAERAFGRPVTVNRVAGSQIHLHVGSVDVEGPPTATNVAYREALGELPLVQDEGDGVRSYVGVLLAVTAAQYPLVLIDEPEAFLHPPQERQLGRELGALASDDSQLILASHSADFLQGVLDAAEDKTTVVRLTREGEVNRAAVLPSAQLSEFWADPLLRYSSLLEGLFHEGVVICESDSDCRFYQATLDAYLDRQDQPNHDLLFSHTGGKHRIPTALDALRPIGVSIEVIADFDVLSEEGLLRSIVERLGGSWTDCETDWRTVKAAVDQLGARPGVVAVRERIEGIFDGTEENTMTPQLVRNIRDASKVEDGWARVKRGGLGDLPQGNAAQAGQRLIEALHDIGLHVVPVGELERWAPDIPGHGPAWVSAALEAGVHEREGDAADFVARLR